jgi:hypothetical protein
LCRSDSEWEPFDGDHAELVRLEAANDNQTATLKALDAKFEAYKAAHP